MGGKEKFMVRAAVYLILVKDGRVLLSRRYKTGWMDGMYSLVAGHIDGNEPVGNSMCQVPNSLDSVSFIFANDFCLN